MTTDDASNYGIEAYGLKAYWNGEKYVEEILDNTKEFKNIEQLLEINRY